MAGQHLGIERNTMQQDMSTWMARNDGGATPGDRERNTMQQNMSTWMARNDGGATPGDREKHNAAGHVNLDGQERWRGYTWG